jgi:zinc transport system substrate-binding protein
MSRKSLILFIAVLFTIGALFFILNKLLINNKPAGSGKLKVITTLYPLYDFARNIGQDKVETVLLLPPGVEPHAFEPKPKDIIDINQADVFIYTGKFMEVWAEDVLAGVINKNLKVVEAGKDIKLIPSVFHDGDEPAGSNDPHVWLDFENAQTMVNNIARGLAEKDPANKGFYLNNAASYSRSLQNLDNKYKTTLATCKTRKIIYGGHYAFGYLAKRYNLEYLTAVAGFEPSSEPTAKDIAKLVEQVKNNNIKYIFYEELASPKLAETIAGETGAKMLLLNAAHNVAKRDLEKEVSFLTIMENNLTNLKPGLDCQ